MFGQRGPFLSEIGGGGVAHALDQRLVLHDAERFERHWDDIRQIDPRRFDETFRRKWRTYLFSCAEMFRSPNGKTGLFQITFSKGNVDYAYPMSRRHLYADDVPARPSAHAGPVA